MDKRGSYAGQLYRGEPQTKSWSLIVSGHVTIRVIEGEGVSGEWKLAAFKKDKVWECRLDPRLKFRVKNDFVQWQTKGGGGETVTYGIRLKDSELATQLSENIEEALNAMLSKPPEADEVQLRVLFSSRDPTLLTVRNSTTMIQVLRMFCHKKQLDVSQFIIALPQDSSHPAVKPSTTVGSLGFKEVQVVKKTAKPSSTSSQGPAAPNTPAETSDSNGLVMAANEQTQTLQVDLPRDERTVVRVSPQTTISDLLKYVCEKRNLELADHRFDLPATEESLAGKTLEQLKISSIRVVLRDGAKRKAEQNGLELECKSPSRTKRQSTKRNKIDTGSESPKANRRQAPPPPPPLQSRRTQPNLIRELAVAAEKKATLRRMERNSDPECTPPNKRQTRPASDTTTPGGVESEGSADGSPDQQRKGKVPLLPNMSRTALQPRSYPAPPPPVPGNKATPPSETPHVQETSTTKTTPVVDPDAPHKAAAPPPVAMKPKKKKQMLNEDVDESDPAPQAPPTKLEAEEEAAVPMAVDMDMLMEEAVALEPTTKKVKKKVKKKGSSEDSTVGEKKEKKTKSGKSTKKKKKVTLEEKGETPREESVEREDDQPSQQLPQDGPDLPPPSAPPPAPQEEEEMPQVDRQTEPQQVTPTLEMKKLTPDLKRQVASLKRRPRGPAPPPPPPGPKTMTIGRIRQIDDGTVKGRGLTISATEGESGRLVSDEVVTKPRSVSEALPPVEKVEVRDTASPKLLTRHRPTRKAPSRPAPSTPQAKEKPKIDDSNTQVDTKTSKETETKRGSGSLHGSPRRPPPTVPSSVPPAVPPEQVETAVVSNGNSSESDIVKMEKDRPNSFGEDDGEGGVEVLQSEMDTIREDVHEPEKDELLQQTFTSSKPPSTPPKPKTQPKQKRSPGQSPSGRRKDAATVICKDTKDGGKELIIKPSPHSKRKLSGPLIFKMPPPPLSPPNKSKSKKPSTPAKPEGVMKKKDVGASAAAAVESFTDNKMDMESADSLLGESSSDTPSKFDSSAKDSPQEPLSDTLVSNEFTNLDELLGDSHQEIVTTDFSIEENLEPIDESNGLEWYESGLPDSESRIPYQDPDLEVDADIYHHGYDNSENAAAALNFNSNNNNNNNNNGLGADDFIDYQDLPPPVLPPEGGDSDEWEWESNRTGELNFDSSSSSAAELSRTSLGSGVIALEEEAGPGGVVLLNIKHTEEEDASVLPKELASKQAVPEGWTSQTATTSSKEEKIMPALIPRDPSIGTQLSELDDVVSSLAELAAEVPVVAPPPTPPPLPPPPPPSQPQPITTSTPTHIKEEHRTTSPKPPPIPLSLPPPLTPSDEEDDDGFPLGPPPPLVTSEPPSLTPSPPSSPAAESKSEQKESEEFADNELLKRLKQRPLKSSSAWRRRRGSKDQNAAEGGESELLEKLKQRQLKYRQKPREHHEDSDTSPISSSERVAKPIPAYQGDLGSNSIPPQQPGVGTGSGTGTARGDNVQLQLQFLQQQVLQQQMLQLQQQFQQLQGYALQQGVSMPTNMMLPVPGGMNQQAAAFMTTPMGVSSSTGLPQQMMMQTSAGQILVPASGSVPQMVHGQGVMPNPQTVPMMPQGQQVPNVSMHGQSFAPNASQQQQVVYGQGIPQTQPTQAPPLMSTSVATDGASVTYQGSRGSLTTGADVQAMVSGCNDAQNTVSSRPDEDTSKSSTGSLQDQSATGSLVTPARISAKRRSEDVRALVLGPLEEQFDSLMDQVRDANPTDVLKKVPEDVGDKEREPSYTGMAAALAEALKQRRLHVADKRKSLGDLDESTSTSEWQSP